MKKHGILALFCALGLAACQSGAPTASQNTAVSADTVQTSHLKETKFSLDDLLGWTFNGIGQVYNESGRQICLQEGENSQGVGLFTPQSYQGDVVMRYKIMPLNAATVLVNLLCMSDEGPSTDLTWPKDYDGSMAPILTKDNYFVAFRNSPHATAPFINKNPKLGQLVIAERDNMIPGVYYDVEVGRVGQKLWLKVDGQSVVSVEDPNILPGGHLGIRLRGLVGHPAACVIRDVSILSE